VSENYEAWFQVWRRHTTFVIQAPSPTVAALIFLASNRFVYLPGDESLIRVYPWPPQEGAIATCPLQYASRSGVERAIERNIMLIQQRVPLMLVPD
jgi:hypothetical protein